MIPAQDALRAGNTALLKVTNRRFLVTVLDLAKETIWVSFPGADYLVEGMGVELEFHDRDGFLRYYSRVVIPPKNVGDGVVLQRVETAQVIRHRRTWRVPTHLPVHLRDPVDNRQWSGRLVDLSAEGGLALTHAAVEAAGAELEAAVEFPEHGLVRLLAKVIHTTPADRLYRVGLYFTKISKTNRDRLTAYLYPRIREHFQAELRELYPPPGQSKNQTRHPSNF